jgi:hypothetical protein
LSTKGVKHITDSSSWTALAKRRPNRRSGKALAIFRIGNPLFTTMALWRLNSYHLDTCPPSHPTGGTMRKASVWHCFAQGHKPAHHWSFPSPPSALLVAAFSPTNGCVTRTAPPNARGEPRPTAVATEERRLLGVGSSAWFGWVAALQPCQAVAVYDP